MLDTKSILLASRSYIKEDKIKSWEAVLSTILFFILTTFIALSSLHWAISLIAAIVSGLLIGRFFVIYHDYLHKTILKKSVIANVIFTVFGWLMLTPKSIWTRSHNYHHKHNSKLYSSSIGSYPVVTKQKYLSFSKQERFFYLFSRNPFVMALGYFTTFTYGMCIQSLINNPSKHLDSITSIVVHYGISILTIIFFGWQAYFLAIFIPFMVACSLGAYLFYAQHNFPEVEYYEKEGWTYIKAALLSSSYMKMSPIMHYFTANIGYHHIHHTNAAIPFYRLPEAYKNIPAFRNAKTTTLTIPDIIKCLRLKVWDPEQNRMITYKEIYA